MSDLPSGFSSKSLSSNLPRKRHFVVKDIEGKCEVVYWNKSERGVGTEKYGAGNVFGEFRTKGGAACFATRFPEFSSPRAAERAAKTPQP